MAQIPTSFGVILGLLTQQQSINTTNKCENFVILNK